jgi:hypothetical protein
MWEPNRVRTDDGARRPGGSHAPVEPPASLTIVNTRTQRPAARRATHGTDPVWLHQFLERGRRPPLVVRAHVPNDFTPTSFAPGSLRSRRSRLAALGPASMRMQAARCGSWGTEQGQNRRWSEEAGRKPRACRATSIPHHPQHTHPEAGSPTSDPRDRSRLAPPVSREGAEAPLVVRAHVPNDFTPPSFAPGSLWSRRSQLAACRLRRGPTIGCA